MINNKFVKFFAVFIFTILVSLNFSMSKNNFSKSISTDSRTIRILEKNFVFGFNIKFIDERFVLYKQPAGENPENGYPIIFLFHGAVQHAFSWFLGFNIWGDAQTSFTKSALENNFFVIGLESQKPIRPGPRGWHSFEKNISQNNDISYVNSVISWLENSLLPVDTENIYAAGFSSGAFMCSRIAQSIGNKFKGVILNSGCNANSIDITNKGPVFNFSKGFNIPSFHPPALLIHGEKDMIVPTKGSESYYYDLNKSNINTTKLFDESKGHIWLKDFNNEIIKWIKTH